jgi:hypothetical protein
MNKEEEFRKGVQFNQHNICKVQEENETLTRMYKREVADRELWIKEGSKQTLKDINKLKQEYLKDLIEIRGYSKANDVIWINAKIERLKEELGEKGE